MVIKDNLANLDLEAKGDKASNTNSSNKDNKDNKKLPLLKALEKEIPIPIYNYTIPLTLDGNQTDN